MSAGWRAQRARNCALDVNFHERGPSPPPSPEAQGDMPASASAQAAGEPPRHRRPKPRHGGVESFDDAALLAELGDEGREGADGSDGEETHEELERRLRREIAAMPDTMALEEAALMRDLASMKEEPDEGDVLMAQLMAEEEAERRAREARKASASASASSASSAPTAVIPDAAEIAAMRDACLQEKREAVRLKRAGDIDGAKEALRRAKAISARADEAEASAANAPAREIAGDAGDADDSSVETLTRAVDAARREAVAHKRAGDMVSARAALTKSKELRVRLDAAVAALEASRNTERDTEHAKDTPKADDVDTMIAEAIGTVVKIISDDPDSKVTARRKKPQKDEGDSEPGGDHDDDDDDDDDDALLRRELGDDYEAQREHWGGDYHEPEPESETELVAARVAELENLVDAEKRTALERKRAGDHEGARSALRAMKAAQAELADASAMLAALED